MLLFYHVSMIMVVMKIIRRLNIDNILLRPFSVMLSPKYKCNTCTKSITKKVYAYFFLILTIGIKSGKRTSKFP